ncbi:MAG TPA: cyanophycin synthetase, partial [Bacteriovoracaceae bacterium]|nr:cyanophycin synthetase [Bacteriovoracaceae bacterium]
AYIAVNFFPQFKEKIIQAAATFRPTPNRSQWIKVEEAKVFLDAYNANPSSMKAALQGFKEQLLQDSMSLDQSCVVLGDMNELGVSSAAYHQEIGTFVKELGFNNIIFIGRFAQDYIKGAKAGHAYENAAQFKAEYQKSYLRELSYHFIKGSRSLQLESLFDIT